MDFYDTQTLTLRAEHPYWFYGYVGLYIICAALFLAAAIAYWQKWRQQ